MSTLSLDPGNHPQRRAALAAHALREALATIGLLESVPECIGAVTEGRAVVRIGEIDATAALSLAMQLTRAQRSRKRKRPARSAESGAS
jgi:hypothetical protein